MAHSQPNRSAQDSAQRDRATPNTQTPSQGPEDAQPEELKSPLKLVFFAFAIPLALAIVLAMLSRS